MSTVLETPEVAPETADTALRQARRGEPVWELARQFPLQGEWTEEDYWRFSFERMVELSNGCLEFLPMTSVWHEIIVRFLADRLLHYVAERHLGDVFRAPVEIRLWKGEIRQPDVFWLNREEVARLRRLQFKGQPRSTELVMEIVSPGPDAVERDYLTKRQVYARARIFEYWIVDPEQQQISLLVLDGENYTTVGEYAAGAIVESRRLPGFKIAIDDVFRMPDEQGGK